MSRPTKRTTLGVNQTQANKPVEIRVGEVWRLTEDKQATAGVRGTSVTGFAWVSNSNALPVAGAEQSGNVGTVLAAPQSPGLYRIAAKTTFADGTKTVTSWRVDVPRFPENRVPATFNFLELMAGPEFGNYLLTLGNEEVELA